VLPCVAAASLGQVYKATLAATDKIPVAGMAGDQQWLFGILLSAVIGAAIGRKIQPEPIYHALWQLGRSPDQLPDQRAPRR